MEATYGLVLKFLVFCAIKLGEDYERFQFYFNLELHDVLFIFSTFYLSFHVTDIRIIAGTDV